MEFEQLNGRYLRLRQELASAYAARPWHDGHIDRLANDLASIERQLSAAAPSRAQKIEVRLPSVHGDGQAIGAQPFGENPAVLWKMFGFR